VGKGAVIFFLSPLELEKRKADYNLLNVSASGRHPVPPFLLLRGDQMDGFL